MSQITEPRETGGHTPGPWRIFEHSWSDTSVLAEGFDHAVCLLDINHATEESQASDEAVMAANARLIAAAPDLLQALNIAAQFMSIASDWEIDVAEINGEMRSIYELLDVVRAAIAKATGSRS